MIVVFDTVCIGLTFTLCWRLKRDHPTVPHIFSQWWIYWNAALPDHFPTLPAGLNLLTEQEKADLLSRPELPLSISDAADTLWNSEYRSLIELMLKLFHIRPNAQNSIQHPRPSAAFAHSHIDSNFGLVPEQDVLVRSIIDEGRRYEGGEWVPLFDHNTTNDTVG